MKFTGTDNACNKESLWDWGWLTALTLIALAYLVLASAINFSAHETFWGAEWDGYSYFLRDCLSTDQEAECFWPNMRGAGLLLAGIFVSKFVSDPQTCGQLVSLFAGAIFIWVSGLMGALLTSRRDVGILTALLLAISEGTLFYGMIFTTDMLFTASAMAGLVCLTANLAPPGNLRAWATGVLLTFCYITRFQGIVFLMGGLACMLWVAKDWRSRTRLSTMYLLGTGMVFAAAWWYSKISGNFEFQSIYGGGLLVDSSILAISDATGGLWDKLNHIYVGHGLIQFLFLTEFVLLVLAIQSGFFRKAKGDWRIGLMILLSLLYFAGVVWHHSHGDAARIWEPADSRRYFLPILPIITIAAAYGLANIRSRVFKTLALVTVLGWMTAYAAFYFVPRFHGIPSSTVAFAKNFQQCRGADNPLVAGYPIEMFTIIPRFHKVYFDIDVKKDETIFPKGFELAMDYDYLILPKEIVDRNRAHSGPGNWIDRVHALDYCYEGFCAFRPISKKPLDSDR